MHTASQTRISLVSPAPWWLLTLILSFTPQTWLVPPQLGSRWIMGKSLLTIKYCHSLLCEFNFWELSFTLLPPGRWPALVENKDNILSPQSWHGVIYSHINLTVTVIHSLQVRSPSSIQKWYILYYIWKIFNFCCFTWHGRFSLALNLAILYGVWVLSMIPCPQKYTFPKFLIPTTTKLSLNFMLSF